MTLAPFTDHINVFAITLHFYTLVHLSSGGAVDPSLLEFKEARYFSCPNFQTLHICPPFSLPVHRIHYFEVKQIKGFLWGWCNGLKRKFFCGAIGALPGSNASSKNLQFRPLTAKNSKMSIIGHPKSLTGFPKSLPRFPKSLPGVPNVYPVSRQANESLPVFRTRHFRIFSHIKRAKLQILKTW